MLELGVCSWSLDREDAVRAIRLAGSSLGVRAVQVGFFSHATVEGASAESLAAAADAAGCTIVGTFVGFESEDYTSIATIAETGGFLPDTAWEGRLDIIRRVAALTGPLGCPYVGVHVGTIPEDETVPAWDVLVSRTRIVADELSGSDLTLLLETGREPVAVLLRFIDAVARDNVSVGFDPGNLTVYGVDDPVRAVATLRGRFQLMHLKDAFHSENPGVEYGRRAELGAGDTQIPRILSKLRVIGFSGPVLVEVAGRGGDITPTVVAVDYVRSMLE